MADKASGARAADDAQLLNRVRTGDTSAFGVLYQRHVAAVRRLARELVMSPAEADHLTAETFALVHDVTQRGGGPTDAFRPYVLTALRRVAADQVRDWRVPTAGHHDPGEPLPSPGRPSPDDSPVTRAFRSLPERWRAVLWHTDIEEEPAAEVAPLLGTTPEGVAELRRSAREGLRQAIVRAHIARTASPPCSQVAERLDEYQRGTLPAPDASAAAGHLEQCADCTAVLAALGGVTAALRNEVAPVYLGPVALQYLLGARRAILAEPGAPPPADTREFGAVTAGPAAGVLGQIRRLSGRAWVGVASGLAACAVAAVALAATGPSGGGHDKAAGATSSAVTATQAPSRSPAPSPSATHRARHRSAASTTPPPSPQATTAPAAIAQLTAAVSLQRGFGFLPVSFQVSNTGNAPTGTLSATITLPAGSTFVGLSRHGGDGSWTCEAVSGGASCQHPAISAGAQAVGTVFIIAGRSACGQPVQFSAASGGATASAESPQGIQCGR